MFVSPTVKREPEELVRNAETKPAKKKLIRRTATDYSQMLRRAVQLCFLILNVWLGIQFYIFVRYCENPSGSSATWRPPGVEGWLPIAALMNLKVFLLTFEIPRVHPAGMFLLITFLAISIIFRKAFCSWLCPVGTISEVLWKGGRRLFSRNLVLPRWLDVVLRSIKYILLGLFVFAVSSMSVDAIRAFLEGPYGIVADVKMLNFFRHLSSVAAIVILVIVLASVFIQNFWCRYLCPYGALMGLAALFSPTRIRREPNACIDCGKCAKACPSVLSVDKLVTVRSAECTNCLECVAICPAEGALRISVTRKRVISTWVVAAGIAALFFGTVLYAKFSGHWATDVPEQLYLDLVPKAQEFVHP